MFLEGVEATSGDSLGTYTIWSNDIKQMTIDSQNNIYIVSSTWWINTLQIYSAFSPNDFITEFYNFVNSNGGKWPFQMIEYIIILIFPFILIILCLAYGLIYWFNFYKSGK